MSRPEEAAGDDPLAVHTHPVRAWNELSGKTLVLRVVTKIHGERPSCALLHLVFEY